MTPPTNRKPLGVLILHGFTGSLDTVRALVPVAEELGLPYRMPVLRGHGTRYEDLEGVTARDWYEDAERALLDLRTEAERVAIVGLSMGGLVTLELAMNHGEDVAALVLVAPAMRFVDPLVHLTPLLKLLVPYWPSRNSFHDRELKKACTNYERFSTRAFASLLNYGNEMERRLDEVTTPTLVLQSRVDQIVHPITARILEERLGSTDKRVVWFERSGHEMLQDLERERVVATIAEHLRALKSASPSPEAI